MNRSDKEAIVAEVAEKVSRASALYFADFSGLTVGEATELRREFRKAGIEYRVVKNTLVKKALERITGYDSVYDRLTGPTGIAFSYGDAIAPAKIIKKFSEKSGKLKLKVAVLEKQIFDGSQLEQLSKLPGRAELMAGVIGSIHAPISGIVGAIGAVMRDLVNVIDAIEKKKAA